MPLFRNFVSLFLVLLVFSFTPIQSQETPKDAFQAVREGINRFGSIYYELVRSYVDSINHDVLLKASIDGMLSKLDPYTVYLEKDEKQELEMLNTGVYGGIGVELGVRGSERELTIMSVFDGTPASRAGLRSGDVIIQVDTLSTKGWTTSTASKHLRGTPNTPVAITIKRGNEILRFDLVRAIIEIRDVAFSHFYEDGTGYIKLVRFSKNASRDLSMALDSLKRLGMTKLILDLRQNPGGLLQSAVEVSSLFLDDYKTIVSVQSKDPSVNQEFKSGKRCLYNGPMVVLVDNGSASASEIVAGALQDWDRAVILGQSTFGKGLVQSVRQLENDGALKLTTGKYYTPSGRLIQKVDYFHGVDSMKFFGKEYATSKGRKFSSLGGIQPDIEIGQPEYGKLTTELIRQGLVSNFIYDANLFTTRGLPLPIVITDSIWQSFHQYITSKGFEAPLSIDAEWIAFKKWLDSEGLNVESSIHIESFNRLLALKRQQIWDREAEQVKRYISIELAASLYGVTGRYRQSLESDPLVERAKEILASPEYLSSILSTPQ